MVFAEDIKRMDDMQGSQV